MLDITQALSRLSSLNSPLSWDIHVVAVKNEVKEILLLSGGNGFITAIDLTEPEKSFVFTREEESNSVSGLTGVAGLTSNSVSGLYIYEPSAAILKAGAYKLIAQRFNLTKLDVNTHLYVSDTLIPDFPGRVWQIEEIINHKLQISNANVLVRNYPLTPEQLKKKLHLRDGGTAFIIGCSVAGKPTLFKAQRVARDD